MRACEDNFPKLAEPLPRYGRQEEHSRGNGRVCPNLMPAERGIITDEHET